MPYYHFLEILESQERPKGLKKWKNAFDERVSVIKFTSISTAVFYIFPKKAKITAPDVNTIHTIH
jgi:hypothetical protein